MKFVPKPRRVNTEEPLNHGLEAVIMLALFVAAGFGLDHWFGTLPVFVIVMTVVGSVGIFARFYYGYAARMDELDAERRAKLAGPAMSAPTADATMLAATEGAPGTSVEHLGAEGAER